MEIRTTWHDVAAPHGPRGAAGLARLKGVCHRCGKKGHDRTQCRAKTWECKLVCINCGAIGMHSLKKCVRAVLSAAAAVPAKRRVVAASQSAVLPASVPALSPRLLTPSVRRQPSTAIDGDNEQVPARAAARQHAGARGHAQRVRAASHGLLQGPFRPARPVRPSRPVDRPICAAEGCGVCRAMPLTMQPPYTVQQCSPHEQCRVRFAPGWQ